MISGAMQPGVPQRQNKQGSSSLMAARPRSTITGSRESRLLNMMFSILMSRCITPRPCMWLRPSPMPTITYFTQNSPRPFEAFTRSRRVPPSNRSVRTQRAEADSQTLWIFNILRCSKALSREISLRTLSARSGLPSRKLFRKTLAAMTLPSATRSTLQTVDVLPLPILARILNSSWKPTLLRSSESRSSHSSSRAAYWRYRCVVYWRSLMRVSPYGTGVLELISGICDIFWNLRAGVSGSSSTGCSSPALPYEMARNSEVRLIFRVKGGRGVQEKKASRRSQERSKDLSESGVACSKKEEVFIHFRAIMMLATQLYNQKRYSRLLTLHRPLNPPPALSTDCKSYRR